jgi:hypothetical protein
MSVRPSASACSRSVVDRRPDWRAKIMSMDSRNSSSPPAMRNAGTPIPRASSRSRPARENTSKIAAASPTPHRAMRRR